MKKQKDKDSSFDENIAILGCGNIGGAIVRGLTSVAQMKSSLLWLSRHRTEALLEYSKLGCNVTSDNSAAVASCRTVVIAVQPGQVTGLLDEIRPSLSSRKHIVLSLATGVSMDNLRGQLGNDIPVARVMPNIAAAIGESMTCVAANGHLSTAIKVAEGLFNRIGTTLIIDEDQMVPATALCACGVAFFLRSIRAASQGGIQIGFHWDVALKMAAQTAKGAASLLLQSNAHPESEIDRVTTPRGCTIAGLNQMEHEGFSSAMIKGLVTSAQIAASLFPHKN